MTASDDTGARTPRRSREDVLAAAMTILDENGLPDLTMRRLAGALGVQPSALYWHVPNKQTLLALIADRIVSAARAPEAEGWMAAVRGEALALRDALLAYRDGAEVVSSTLALGLGADEPRQRLAAALGNAGLDQSERQMAASVLLHFILGHVWHEQQRLQADSLGVVAPQHSADPGVAAEPHHGPGSFEFGLDLLLDGVAARSGLLRG
jgi:TetR/AcrR family transcriptional regulator, tetracycline repressor protein